MTAGDGTGRPRRRRPLHAEEKALWDHVTRSIRPLQPLPRLAEAAEPPPEPAPPEAEKPKPARPLAAPPAPKPRPGPPALAPLEPKLRRRLSRGAEVDARLDLHGLTQAAAHGRLIAFLRGAQGAGHSLVLVITGKGGEGMQVLAGEGGRGVLRRLVPQWLAAPELRAVVVGFETAGRGHGGEGALYVRVRRVREGRP
ncbi:Smr/MutS family protein [Starkeya koreensis]|uniref:Smr/MutS family protein n=1 Tax=Ancylobacter koreensis TaxID=266121 RepID=A0ABT0DI80_9HYPH|nr:Smr/MutS family protein [Ancylobacter koreensis]MCK0206792.1 Smr/MutS family protein [Ancylobacter koreensis]